MNTLESQIYQQLASCFPEAEHIQVQCEGNHCAVSLLCTSFTDLRVLLRQQKINACLKEFITSGKVHALRIDAQSPQ